jgi:DNA-binding phage protein
MALQLKEWNTLDYLKTDEDIALYLEGCFEEAEGDIDFMIHALETASKAKHLNQFDNSSNAEQLSFVTVLNLMKELGLKIQVSPIERNAVL